MPFHIFIVEDHPAVLNGYELILKRELDLQVVGTASSAEEALILIPQKQPNLVILDISLPRMDGLTLSKHLYELQPALPILLVSSQPRTLNTLRNSPVFTPNIKGYIHKQEVVQNFLPTIRQVLSIP